MSGCRQDLPEFNFLIGLYFTHFQLNSSFFCFCSYSSLFNEFQSPLALFFYLSVSSALRPHSSPSRKMLLVKTNLLSFEIPSTMRAFIRCCVTNWRMSPPSRPSDCSMEMHFSTLQTYRSCCADQICSIVNDTLIFILCSLNIWLLCCYTYRYNLIIIR